LLYKGSVPRSTPEAGGPLGLGLLLGAFPLPSYQLGWENVPEMSG